MRKKKEKKQKKIKESASAAATITVNIADIAIVPSKKKQARPEKNRRVLKKKAVAIKGGKCEHCGYDKCFAALTFHHLDPEKKNFNISSVINLLSWEEVVQELNKCILLCQNCHTELHNIVEY